MMKYLRTLSIALGAVSAALASAPATAQDRSFSIPPGAMVGSVQGTSVDLPKSGTPVVAINFTVPMDHAPGTQIFVRVYMQMNAGSPCTAQTQLVTAARRRPGQVAYITTFPNIDRVVPIGGVEATDFAGADNTVVVKSYAVRTPAAAPFNGLRPGDNINLRIQRLSEDPSDICSGTLSVWGADVRYTLATPPV